MIHKLYGIWDDYLDRPWLGPPAPYRTIEQEHKIEQFRKAIEDHNRKKDKDMNQCKCNCNKSDVTDLIVIADRSGSMSNMVDGAIQGFNSYISSQKELPGKCNVTMMLFDDQHDIVYNRQDIKFVAPLNRQNFVPRGSTALFDAIGITYTKFKHLGANEKVVCIVITDSFENASKEYTRDSVQKMIKEGKEKGWQFVFIGCEEGSLLNAQQTGFVKDSCLSYNPTNEGIAKAYNQLSESTSNYRSGNAQCMSF